MYCSPKWNRDWTRIGRYDKCRRRSTWARIEFSSETEDAVAMAVELRSGREGDDAFGLVLRDWHWVQPRNWVHSNNRDTSRSSCDMATHSF